MPVTLIILAHPDSRSFNGAWAEATRKASEALGHEVLVSDLTALGFDAVEKADHFADWPKDRPFDPLKAQENAQTSYQVLAEIEKLERADRIVFHFPIWWFSPPAVLKGWFDRVLLHGRLHSVDARFDKGICRGKKALFCVSTGATEAECGPDGKEGDIHLQLWPAAQTLRYLGMTVLQPVIEFGVHGYFEGTEKVVLQDRLTKTLAAQTQVIERFDTLPRWLFNGDSDFDASGRLKPDAPSYSPFIRHR